MNEDVYTGVNRVAEFEHLLYDKTCLDAYSIF